MSSLSSYDEDVPERRREVRPEPQAPARPDIGQILALQRSAGNQAVIARLKRTPENATEVDQLKAQYLAAHPGNYRQWDALLSAAPKLVDLSASVNAVAAPLPAAPAAAAAVPAAAARVNPFGEEEIRDHRGMADDEARRLADFYRWQEVRSAKWFCTKNKSHTPKGAVFQDARGRYYGADNTGHAGFAFKVWSGRPNDLTYLGCAPHNNPDAIVQRGTQRTQTKAERRKARQQEEQLEEPEEDGNESD